ncbi:hypothetical protein ANT_02940 [Anaerolinea thermophila UNI-1]|uniref:Uncharacterized protein n=1 Tax=Anaerolinea thermophila (strain DSM 14523 / JCM 11388 / NBRC 100420 / UNI-1) TaxID=926569 RepID=E8MZZ3_ANATU|nr:hypothetical protein ANT_02940 [Anaerolinea thermophila UNI-1]
MKNSRVFYILDVFQRRENAGFAIPEAMFEFLPLVWAIQLEMSFSGE